MTNTIKVAGICPVSKRSGILYAEITVNTDTGTTSARTYSAYGSGPTLFTWAGSLAQWKRNVAKATADAAARAKAVKAAKATKKAKPIKAVAKADGAPSEKNLRIRMKRIDRYVKLVIPALVAKEPKCLKDEKVQRNLAIRAFNIARKLAAKRADVYKQVKGGELV